MTIDALTGVLAIPALSAEVLQRLSQHPLHGNVRELENLLHRAVALSDGDVLHIDVSSPAAHPEPAGALAATPTQAPAAPQQPGLHAAGPAAAASAILFSSSRVTSASAQSRAAPGCGSTAA